MQDVVWSSGENAIHDYYCTEFQGHFLYIFKHKEADERHLWTVEIDGERLLYDKTRNDRQREEEGKFGCHLLDLSVVHVFSSKTPEYAKKKAIEAMLEGPDCYEIKCSLKETVDNAVLMCVW